MSPASFLQVIWSGLNVTMKYLFVPANNSLSHLAKAIAVREVLVSRGHEALVAVSQKNAAFMASYDVPHAVLPDLQESDGCGFPSVEWFRSLTNITDSIKTQLKLIDEYKPDRVLGIFHFTIKAVAAMAGVPFDSLACGCMLPGFSGALGYGEDEIEGEWQQGLMAGFFQYAGRKLSQGLSLLGQPPIKDSRMMLVGERTFLWDFPEFLAVDKDADLIHVGPISWRDWSYDKRDWDLLHTGGRPLAIISFGTCVGNADGALRMVRVLGDLGFHVLLTAAARLKLDERMKKESWLTVCEFAPFHQLLPQASLLVSHGGQMSIFEALAQKVPVAVMPFQPEQAHNGVCLERLGCGKRLVPGQPFLGDPEVYLKALNNIKDEELAETFMKLVQPGCTEKLDKAAEILGRYHGAHDMAPYLEGGNG